MCMSVFDYMRAALRPAVTALSLSIRRTLPLLVRCPCFGGLLRPLRLFLVGLIANAAAGGPVLDAKGPGHGEGTPSIAVFANQWY